MNRQNNVPFNPKAVPKGVPVFIPQPPGRIPKGFREAMLHIPVKPALKPEKKAAETAAQPPKEAQKRPAKPVTVRWKSSFKPLDEQDDSVEANASDSQRVEMYDPYDIASSDSEHEMPPVQSPPDQEGNLDQSKGAPKKRRWASCYSESLSEALDQPACSPEASPSESHSPDPGLTERTYSPTEQLEQPEYDSISRPPDHRVCSPDRLIHSSSTQSFPELYEMMGGGQRTNGEERIPEYRREMTTTVRLSPPRLHRDYQYTSEYVRTERDKRPPSPEVPRRQSSNVIMDKIPIFCDLCDVELANSRELEDHLESKSHWDTLEHIQQQNNYDDVVIAFLQEVLLYKSHHCSRAIEDGALQALQENDSMTKVEMFHCAACRVFVSSSASSVHTHITSQEHLSNTKEFQAQQRHSCLGKAETMMEELRPQFEDFLKGGSPFE